MSIDPSKETPAAPSQVTSTEPKTEKPQKQAKAAKKAKTGGGGALAALEHCPPPEYLAHRMTMFDRLKAVADAEAANQERAPVTITLGDGKTKEATSWETTPLDIAKGISKSLSERVVIAKVNGVLWDLTRPFESDATLELLDFENDEGKMVFWHSSAHMVGEACERHYACHLCIGPPIEQGFYYEMGMPDDRAVSQADYANIETLVKSITKEKQPFERLVITKDDLLEMFKHNPYKIHIIQDKIPDGTSTTVYRCGPLIDLCRGPHVPHTGRVKALAIIKNSASYFLGDAANDSLQRIYGISFPDNKQLTEYKHFLAEAAKRDHRKIGREQELFMFHDLSPGSCFFLPHGTRIHNALVNFMKEEYVKRGFQEVISPNLFNAKLWETSGHWANYRDDMFTFDAEKETWALKPMNCPGHCLIFGHRERSYRELPLRLADFGVLHRNEASGALTGLTRVRRFQQDDAHIFCRQDQIEEEMRGCLDFLQMAYGVFGLGFHLKLSTRPEKYLGELAVWDEAEKRLAQALDSFGHPWTVDPGDGAFYGPKIDITISDALRRKHQCATIQLDFQLPERFNLQYRSADSDPNNPFSRPVIIHRAILGSVERQMAILTEHFVGKWPFWLSPRQVMVVPVAAAFYDYADRVRSTLHEAGLYVDVDNGENTLNKKIRNAEIAQYNFILVVGQDEEETGSVNVRSRDDVGTKAKGQTQALDDVLGKMVELKKSKALESKI
ncbi:hypothetical protein BJ684DRAFT_20334 [Piptocephalis cylindrospora]|uniref:Threonine--tRNA ligase, cytoplasmic n=1 Tax=Piptocephalis cylindrospora TaxID=1907219 RepID=A0A4P9Y2N4_9FUNG|nr:hypothetical protein BJ684DRAFT_20334 [Piptocephalis cylindrospora]|eukprot:RKP13158.1 hypothetical protein BJ684DRAFT_20334 [Piptocephalis cylindrospora]